MKNNLLISTLLISVLLSACGSTDSNPLENYQGIKGTTPTNEKAVVQTIVTPDLFVLEVDGSNEINVGQFTEGESSSVLLKITPKSTAITSYSIEMSDFSNLNRPVLERAESNGVYSLTWLAPVGTIPNGGLFKTFHVKLQITVREATNRQLIGAASIKTLDVVVNRNNLQPKLVGRTDLSKGVDEGQVQSFTVDVMDPTSAVNPKLPEVQITPYINSNTEAYRADGNRYLELDDKKEINPEKLPNNVYRFYYNLLVENLPLDRDRRGQEIPAATTVDMCFLMRALSGSGTSSDQIQVCTKARYASQPPVITFADIAEIKAGHESTISIHILTAHPLSAVVVAKSAGIIANLSGKKEITCASESADKKNSQICVIKWTPACISSTASIAITVKADATLADKTKSTTVIKNLIAIPDLELCPIAASIKKGAK